MERELIVQVGEMHYPVRSGEDFDAEWGIGSEPALRWFSRACSSTGKLTGHQPCGSPTYDARRKTLFTREDYLTWAHDEQRGPTTSGCYFSPNLFYRWRNKANLSGFCANWLEIDTRSHAALTEQQALIVLGQVANALEYAKLPYPTAWVLTGSGGVHIYWRYESPVMTVSREHRAELTDYWHKLNAHLVEALERARQVFGYTEWSVDRSASNNPSGVMRLPGSVHGKTSRPVRYLNGGPAYAMAQLGSQLGLSALPLSVMPPVKQASGSPKRENAKGAAQSRNKSVRFMAPAVPEFSSRNREPGTAQGYDTPPQRQALLRVVQQWEAHLAESGTVPKGQRDLTVFHLYNCARRIWAPGEAWAFIQRINQRFVGFPLGQLEAYLSSASERVYYYALPRLKGILCTQLGLPLEGAFPAGRRAPLSHEEVIERQSRAGDGTSRLRRSRTLVRVAEAARQLCWRNGGHVGALEVSRIWPALGVSRATAYRHWPEVRRQLTPFTQLSLSALFSAPASLKRSPLPYNAYGAGAPESSSALDASSCAAAGACDSPALGNQSLPPGESPHRLVPSRRPKRAPV